MLWRYERCLFLCLLFYVLSTSKVISGWVQTCDNAHSWWLYSAASLGTPGHWHYDLLSHSVALSWCWDNQSLAYPNNAKHQAWKWQVYILKSLVWLDLVSNPHTLGSNPLERTGSGGSWTENALKECSVCMDILELTVTGCVNSVYGFMRTGCERVWTENALT